MLVRYSFIVVLINFLVFSQDALCQGLFINEFMGSNNATIQDEDGDYSDWIEIYNSGASSIDLTGYYLSDNLSDPTKWQFPQGSVPACGYLIIWASDKNKVTAGGELHSNFKIKASGEPLVLSMPDGITPVDQAPAHTLDSDFSAGRLSDGEETWVVFSPSTPGTSNSTSLPMVSAPTFSHSPGYFPAPIQLVLSDIEPGAYITYTLDGSEPTTSSPVFQGSLEIADRIGDPEVYALIPTNFFTSGDMAWRLPREEIYKISTVRMRAFAPGHNPSPIISGSFFVGSEFVEHAMFPIVSLMTEPDNLFDDEIGIYVPGNTWSETNSNFTGNYFESGRDWERPVHLEIFDIYGSRILAQDAGMRISGNMTVRFPQKSLKLYARDDYGDDDFDLALFDDIASNSYKRFRIRNSGNDWAIRGFLDLAAHEIIEDMGFVTQAGRPVIHFIDGEYWGFANLREEYSRFYFERHFGIPADDVILLENQGVIDDGEPGSNTSYFDMLDFIDANDLSITANYDYIKTLMDVENFIAYQTAEMYLANRDWPANNIAFWRKNTAEYEPYSPFGHDGRWRWAFFDLDVAFQHATYNMVEHATDTATSFPSSPPWSTALLRGLLDNAEFTTDLINSIADHLNSTFIPHRIEDIFNDYLAIYEPALPDLRDRWDSENHLPWAISSMTDFANIRPAIHRQNVVDYFSLPGTSNIELDLNDSARGSVRINSLLVDENLLGLADPEHPYPWTGEYFQGNSVSISAIPEPGFVFLEWLETGQTSATIEFVPVASDTVFTAVFEADQNPPVLVHHWHFNELPAGQLVSIPSDESLTGAPVITYSGTGAGYMDLVAGTTVGAQSGVLGGTALRVRNPADTRELIAPLPTTGFMDPVLQVTGWRSSNGAREVWLEYATASNPVVWIPFGDLVVLDEVPSVIDWDFAGISAVVDNADFQIKIIFSGEHASGTSGNTRFDNLALLARREPSEAVVDEPLPSVARAPHIQAHPNPFNPVTTLDFDIPRSGQVSVQIFDLAGRRVRTLFDGKHHAGSAKIVWEGTDSSGRTLSSGTYLCRLKTLDGNAVVKLQLVQ